MKTATELPPLFDEALAQILVSTNVLLVSPVDPDADSCMSMVAFREFLRWLGAREGKKFRCRLFAPEKPRPNTLFQASGVNIEEEVRTALPSRTVPDIVVLFDYGQFERTGLEPLRDSGAFFLGFDHHPESESSLFPVKNGLEIVAAMPSTTALLFRFFEHVGYPIPPEVATQLLTGLVADTGRFSNDLARTNPEAFIIAGELMKRGARLDAIYDAMIQTTPLAKFWAQQKALAERLQIDETTGFAFLWFKPEDLARWGAAQEDIMPLMGQLRHIKEVKVAAIYSELPSGEWQASLRANPKNGASVRDIALAFGGGGHEKAAGFRSSESPEPIFKKLKDYMKKYAG